MLTRSFVTAHFHPDEGYCTQPKYRCQENHCFCRHLCRDIFIHEDKSCAVDACESVLIICIMERTESFYFFKLLNLYKRRFSYEHHNQFLNACKGKGMVPRGLKLRTRANIEVVSDEFGENWESILTHASRSLRDLLLQETDNVQRRIVEEIEEIQTSMRSALVH